MKIKLLVLFLSIFSFASLLRPGYFPMHDDMQAMRTLQMDKCIHDFQIPCRWVPDMGYGYGYPQFNFYSPLPYYVMESFHLVGFSVLASVKIGFLLTILISAIGMYLLGRELWGKAGGVLSALFFVYAPYRAVDMYVRGAVGEFWALSFLPFVFYFSKRIFEKDKWAPLGFSLSLACLLLSHNVTTVMTLPFLALWIGVLYINKFGVKLSEKETIKSIILSGLVAFGLGAFFLLPAFLEKKYVHIETLTGGYFDYRAHFVSIKQLLIQNFWGYGSSEMGSYDGLFLGVGVLQWTFALFSSLVFILVKNKKKAFYALFFLLVGFFALFMCHTKSSFIWEDIGFIQIFQFPWRFLVLATFAFSVVAGGFVQVLSHQAKIILITLAYLLLLLFNFSYFAPKTWLNINDSQKFSGENWRLQQTISIFDYLPKSAEFPPADRAPENPQILSGDALISSVDKHTDWVRFEIEVKSKSTIQMPLYYFPGWKVYVDGENQDFRYDNNLGLITFDLPIGPHNVLVKLENTPIRSVSNIISLVSIIGVVTYIYRKKK